MSGWRIHLACLASALVAALATVLTGWTWLLVIAGALLSGAGLAAYLSGRAAILPPAVRAQIDAEQDPERRAEVERAGGMLSGALLLAVGALTVVLGIFVSI